MGLVDVEQFVGGVIYGLIEKNDIPQIQQCLKNTEDVKVEVNKIVNEMATGTFEAIMAGIKDLAALIQELPTDLKDCENIQDDMNKISNWGQKFITPTGLAKLVENVMANWSTIQKDIGDINADISNSKYYEAGQVTADTIIIATGKI